MTNDPRRDAASWQRIDTEVQTALGDAIAEQSSETRSEVVQLIRQQLRHQSIAEFPDPVRQSAALAEVCTADQDSLAVVVGVLALYEPKSRPVRRLWRLLYEVKALDTLLRDDWGQLRTVLVGILPVSPARLYQQIEAVQISAPPEWCASAWDMFVHLADRNSLPHGLPPSVEFLLLLENEVDSNSAQLIRRRNQRWASTYEFTAVLDRRRAIAKSGTRQPEPYIYLVIQIEPDLNPNLIGRYTLSHYRQWHTGTAWQSRRYSQASGVPSDRLEAVVADMVRHMESDWPHRNEEIIIELVLPRALLNRDVAWWRAEHEEAFLHERVLTMTYPVVLRSLDRLRTPTWHRPWRARWRNLREEPGAYRIHRSSPDGADYFTRLEATLNDDHQLAMLLLSEPPAPTADSSGMREVMTALRAGLPVILWHRTEGANDELWEEVRRLASVGGIGALPVQVHKSRLAALRAEPTERAKHPGRHLAVLWDDPDRTPELEGSRQRQDGDR